MNYCEWPNLTAGSRCINCGYMLRMDYAKPPIKRCHGDKPVATIPVPVEPAERPCCGQQQAVIRPATARIVPPPR